jgi:hypothetical protein
MWTNIAAEEAVWVGDSHEGLLLKEDGGYVLLELGGRMIITYTLPPQQWPTIPATPAVWS